MNVLCGVEREGTNPYRRYLCLFFLLLVILVFSGYYFNFFSLDQVIRIIGSGVTVMAIFFAGFQFKANHDWNKRNAAIQTAKEIRNDVSECVNLIDKTFRFNNRKCHEKILVDDIHQNICKCDEKGECIRTRDGKLAVDHEKDGHKIYTAIKNYLSSFEYLAAGVRQGVLDEEIIYTIYGGPMIRAASIFSDYIEHVNRDMYPDRKGKIYIELVKIKEKFKKREKSKEQEERSSPA